MRYLISILLLFSIKLASAQSVEWVKSFIMNGMTFQHFSSITYKNDNLLIGVKAIDTISPADYLNEIYLHSIADNGVTNWSLYFKPLDSTVCSEIKIFNSFVQDSICILVGQCYLSSINNTFYFYSSINLNTRQINSYNVGPTNTSEISWVGFENGNLILVKSINSNTIELNRINVNLNNSTSKQLVLPKASSYYFMNHFYAVEDSIASDNTIFMKMYKMDTNAIIVASREINSNLKVLSNGYSSVSMIYKNGNLFVEGTYEYHLNNPTIPGNELDYFLYKIDPNNLQQVQSFVFSSQFSNTIKSKQEIKFDTYVDKTFIVSKVINDNNLRNVHSFLINNNGVVWSKKLTEPSTNQFHKRFIQSDIVNHNNFTTVLSSLNGEVTLLNQTFNGTIIDSFVTILDTASKSLDVLDAIVTKNDNDIYITGTHVLKNETKQRLYNAKLNFTKSNINAQRKSLISIYPNPATNIATISINNIKEVYLYNTLGETIKVYYNSNTFNTEDLPQGIYTLKIITQSKDVYSSKLAITK